MAIKKTVKSNSPQKVNVPNLVQLFKIGKDELELKYAGEIFALMMRLHIESPSNWNSVDTLILAIAKENQEKYPENSPIRWENGQLNKESKEYTKLQSTTSNVLKKLRELWLASPEREGKNILYSLHLENLKVYFKAITEMNTFGSSKTVKEWLEPKAKGEVDVNSKNIAILLSDAWQEEYTQWEQISLLELKALAQFINLLNNNKTRNILTMLENPKYYVNNSIENGSRPDLWLTVIEIYTNQKIRGKWWEQQPTISNHLWLLQALWLVSYKWTEQEGQPHEWKEHFFFLTQWAKEKYEQFMQLLTQLAKVSSPHEFKGGWSTYLWDNWGTYQTITY